MKSMKSKQITTNTPACQICGKTDAPLNTRGLCENCDRNEKRIAQENVKANLKQKKLQLVGKKRELAGRIEPQMEVYKEVKNYFDKVPKKQGMNYFEVITQAEGVIGIELEPDFLMLPQGAVKLHDKIPEWKLLNVKDIMEFQIEELEREIKDIEENMIDDTGIG